MIVVDTNIICYFYLSGEYSEKARQLFILDAAWCAPVLWQSEFHNVLALYLRKKLIDLDTAYTLSREAELLMKPGECRVASSAVLALVSRSDCSAYDCEFVALAQKLQTQLVTSDKQILKTFPDTAVSLIDFLKRT
jgi:predicted nucleic acid-binding protein